MGTNSMADPSLHVPKGTFKKYGIDLDELAAMPLKDREREIQEKMSQLHAQLKEVRGAPSTNDETVAYDGVGGKEEDKSTRPSGRVIMVTRRLPLDVHFDNAQQKWEVTPRSMDSLNHQMQNSVLVHNSNDCIWLGWHGGYAEPGQQQPLRSRLAEDRFAPVFLDRRRQERFYDGFCKQVLWPLFHATPPTTDDTMRHHGDDDDEAEGGTEQQLWEAYASVNQTFADAIQEIYREGDIIWVQDYHFMLLPRLLRNQLDGANPLIGMYFHLPFPSSELYRILPFREELLLGALAANLVGFQTYDYVRHFLSTAEFLLGVDCRHNGLEYEGSFTTVAICPIGIDPGSLRERLAHPDAIDLRKRLAAAYAGKAVLLSVDDLDNTQGLVHKMLALEDLLARRPRLADQLAFVQVLNCKREGNAEKDTLEMQTLQMVARINSKVAKIGAAGPLAVRMNPPAAEIAALMATAHAYVNTVLRDGMSVAPMEYVVAQAEAQAADRRAANAADAGAAAAAGGGAGARPGGGGGGGGGRGGRVVLSEFAGCASSLGGALLVNPWDTNQLSSTLERCVDEALSGGDPEEEGEGEAAAAAAAAAPAGGGAGGAGGAGRAARHQHMLQYVEANTSRRWGERFLDQLREAGAEAEADGTGLLGPTRQLQPDHLVGALRDSACRLFIFSLEGALCRQVSVPELLAVRADVAAALHRLAEDPANMVVVKSARGGPALEAALKAARGGEAPRCVLAAEHGLRLKWGAESPWVDAAPQVAAAAQHAAWKGDVLRLMEHYAERTPGSYIDDKETTVTWYHVDSDAGHGSWLAKQLLVQLQEASTRLPILVSRGDRCIDVCHQLAPTCPTLAEICLAQMHQALRARHAKATRARARSRELQDPEASDSSSGASAPCPDGAAAAAPPPPAAGEDAAPAVDFVMYMGTGRDFRDEDMYEYLAPPAIDLDQFLHDLQWVEPPAPAAAAAAAAPAAPRPVTPAAAAAASKPPTPTPDGGAAAAAAPPKAATTKMPADSLRRQADITTQQKFQPRRDFPPQPMIFKAMKEKYGADYTKVPMPATAASCWALVLGQADTHPAARALVDSRSPVELYLKDSDLAKGFAPLFAGTAAVPRPQPPLQPGAAVQRVRSEPPPGAAAAALPPAPEALPAPPPPAPAREDRGPSPAGGLSPGGAAAARARTGTAASDADPHAAAAAARARTGTAASDADPHAAAAAAHPKAELPLNTFSCVVGPKVSQAAYLLKNARQARATLKALAAALPPAPPPAPAPAPGGGSAGPAAHRKTGAAQRDPLAPAAPAADAAAPAGGHS